MVQENRPDAERFRADGPTSAWGGRRISRRAALAALATPILAACGHQTDKCDGKCHRPVPRPSVEPPQVRTFDGALASVEASSGATSSVANENGDLAWGQSYAMLGLLRVFQTTRRDEYLDAVFRIATHVLAETDQHRDVADYLGRSGPVWRSGGKYTAWHAHLVSAAAVPLVDIRYAASGASEATVLVAAGSTPTTFTLTLNHPRTGSTRMSNVSTDPQHERYVESVVLRDAYQPGAPWTAKVLEPGVPVAGAVRLEPQFYAFAVSTGMITYPMALFSRIVLEDRQLASGPHRKNAEMILTAVHEAVSFHDSDWAETTGGMSGYISQRGAPVAQDGNYLPLNQSNALGQTLAELFRVTHHHDYRTKVERLADSWRASLRHPISGGGREWPYWPPFSKVFTGYSSAEQVSSYTPHMPPTRHLDDLSHSAITVEFVTAAHAAGAGVSVEDLRFLVATYLAQLKSGPASVRTRFGGPVADPADAVQCARWMGLANSEIAQHVNAVMKRIDPRPTSGSVILGRAYIAWAAGRGLL